MRVHRSLLFILSLTALFSARSLSQEPPLCLVCHSEIKADYMESIHAGANVTCANCHGGNPSALDRSRAHDASFKGTPQREEIPKLCASCHADPILMKPYGLRVDQYTEYQTSQHGLLLAIGDTKVAVCTDCHTGHRILRASEPRSTVHAENIPSTCANCHSDKALMDSYDIPTDQLDDFQKGAHGLALLKEGNNKAPHCATCHGTHGAAPPGIQDVSKVCGTCHVQERLYFDVSPHKRSATGNGLNECTTCHNHHETEPVTGRLFDTACLGCHTQDSKAFLEGQKIKTLLAAAQEALEETEQALDQARKMALDVSAHESRMVEARAYLIAALPVQHTLNVAQVEELTRRTRSIANDIRGAAHGLQGAISIRWLGLTLVWGYLILVGIVVYLYRQARRHE